MQDRQHHWQFFRAGGVDQVAIRSGADIANLQTLDQKLWMALACPAQGIDFDARTLSFLDADCDGRLRAADILETIKWLKEALKSLDTLLPGNDSLTLDAINDQTEVGAVLFRTARKLLVTLGQSNATAVTVADVAEGERSFAQRHANGDGVVPAEAASDPVVAKVIADIIATHGAVPDRSGKIGTDRDKVDAFFAAAALYIAWQELGNANPSILALGPDPAAAGEAVSAVAAKVEDYFTRCRMAAFDARSLTLLSGVDADYQGLSTKELSSQTEALARLPLARLEAGRPLPLTEGVNPAWAGALVRLQAVAAKLLSKPVPVLSESDWQALKSKLAPYEAWLAQKPVTPVSALPIERLREILRSSARGAISDLITADLAEETTYSRLTQLHKLVLLQRDFVKLLNNFVNFSTFFSRSGATFQAGTLYLDSRSCDLCIRVADAGKHAALAGLAKTYLAYCDCTRSSGEKMTIAAAFTGGDVDYLMVGRNGVFYDREGRDWDATITKLIENPISIRQAFWAPYKSFVRTLEEQVTKRAAAADAEASAQMKGAADKTATADQTKAAATKEPPRKMDLGTVAAIGIAIGGIATFLSSILALFFGLGWWMPLGFLGLLLAISSPSMLISWLKLRQRSLGPILDANGWAINGRVRINIPFGSALTSLASIPTGARRSYQDPYLEKRAPWRLYLVLLIVALLGGLWYLGKLNTYLPAHIQSTTVLGEYAPGYGGTTTSQSAPQK